MKSSKVTIMADTDLAHSSFPRPTGLLKPLPVSVRNRAIALLNESRRLRRLLAKTSLDDRNLARLGIRRADLPAALDGWP